MNGFKRLFYKPFFIRLFHWEYWSFNAVYVPIYFIWIGLCFRARSFFFFAASNPSIKNGGFLNESKKDIFQIMPATLQPGTLFFPQNTDLESVLKKIAENQFAFPLIGKPDIGGRGRGVKILLNDIDVKQYVLNSEMDFHIQKFISYKNEVGIFYYRYPDNEKGNISGIVRKEFLKVTGNGNNTILELIQQNKRAILQLTVLQKLYENNLNEILPAGEEKILVPYGNHARGAMFIDDTALADDKLVVMIDELCRQIKDFYFGRLDIRYNDWEELKDGKNFCVIEVNGAGSEPTHIYDPKHSLFFAWKEIVRHWYILWKISRRNHKKGYPYLTLKEGLRMFREDKIVSEKLAEMAE
ncbi:MAG: D-alanine--D-alanine ligase [Bacteroidetes bacterium]|nr:D-alanine--D-alanine ligase [Bacteroidota bacterium]